MELIQIMARIEKLVWVVNVALCCLDTWREVCQESRFSSMVSSCLLRDGMKISRYQVVLVALSSILYY